MQFDLPFIWLLILGFSLFIYIVADGFDLGIGLLFPFITDKTDQDVIVSTVAPVWDGNETWLVLGGAVLMGAFPKAYALLLSALYIPLLIMLAGLIFRGVSFEFRHHADPAHRPFWNKAFLFGSFIATFFQGISLGAFVQGIPLATASEPSGLMNWLTPFSLLTGVGVTVTYLMLGACWLIIKTENELQKKVIHLAQRSTLAVVILMTIVTLWAPLSHTYIADRWFSFPTIYFLIPVPFVVLSALLGMFESINNRSQVAPFLWAIFLVFLGYSGLIISIFPAIIPGALSIYDAAAPIESLVFMLKGALVITPIILIYSAWSYYVFRGKAQRDGHYSL